MMEPSAPPLLALAAGVWQERKLMKQSGKSRWMLPIGLLLLTGILYYSSERQRGLSGVQYLFCAVIIGCGLLGTGIGWLTGKTDGVGRPPEKSDAEGEERP